MKRTASKKIVPILFGLLSTLVTTSAMAEFQLTAFGDTLGYRALVTEDISSVEAIFATRDINKLDYFELNNLCVAQILLEEFDSAISSCATALETAQYSTELTHQKMKKALASVYSNLGVAKAMSGDIAGAGFELEKALSLNKWDSNALSNYDLFNTNLLAGN